MSTEQNSSSQPGLNISEAASHHWDVIIVGTGMGGATLGYELARGGKRVLFCEAGRVQLHPEEGFRGNFAETFFAQPAAPGEAHRDMLLSAGRRAEAIQDVSGPGSAHYIPFLGYGSGGSSALYGAALERLFHQDFTPRSNYPDAPEASLPERWPVTYEDLLPYYQRAESLYRVRGSTDPLSAAPQPDLLPPPPLCSATREIEQRLRDKGLHPYRVPQACEFVDGCRGCQGFLCSKECKNDATRICLRPALDQHDAQLLEACEVIGLEATRSAVTGVVCRQRGEGNATLTGDIVILAAGALETPRILLDSASDTWPNGLANESGLVGRNLMRHYVDLFAVYGGRHTQLPGNLKEIAFNDFYCKDGHKLGTVQSFGALPPAAVIVEEMQLEMENAQQRWLVPLFKMGKPLFRRLVAIALARRSLFASIMEDLPYPDNRIQLAASPTHNQPSPVELRYHVHPGERRRIARFRQQVMDAFKPSRVLPLKQAENNMRLAHACGTCRFGDSPADSVLDPTNRAHGLENLYVVDASFFPTSGGTNPALTIAANALRIADVLLGKKGAKTDIQRTAQ